jgi:type II secretory pathway pseudopilin PulG
MNPEVERIQARIRQIDEYARKGLMPAEEAEETRKALLRRLMLIVVPDLPAPRTPWRVHLLAVLAMLAMVGTISAYLLSGHAGLRRRSEEVLAAGRVAQAQDEASRRERLARIRAGQSIAPDANGVFPDSLPAASASAASSGVGARGAAAAGRPSSSAQADQVAPLLSGHVDIDPKFDDKVSSDDAVFIVVRLPDDPTGLPLAAMRVDVSNLPLDFDIRQKELVGAPERFMRATSVVVTARVSKTESGFAKPGDLIGRSAPVPPWSGSVRVVIDGVVPKP